MAKGTVGDRRVAVRREHGNRLLERPQVEHVLQDRRAQPMEPGEIRRADQQSGEEQTLDLSYVALEQLLAESDFVSIHAPLKPKATRTRGPRQQVEARMAAKPPTKSALDPVRSRECSTVRTFICVPSAWSGPVESGSARFPCAALCHNCVEPNVAHAQASGDLQAFFVHR